MSDSSLFQFQRGDTMAYLLIYVDDMLLVGNSSTLLTEIVQFLGT